MLYAAHNTTGDAGVCMVRLTRLVLHREDVSSKLVFVGCIEMWMVQENIILQQL